MVSPHNTFIDLLPREEARLLESMCRPVELELGELLQEADAPTRHVYFPVDALVCLFATCEREPCAEVAMVGHEGMVGIQLALGIASAPLTAIVQEGGTALRADAEDFDAEILRNAELRAAVNRFVHVTLRQMAASSACLHTHQLSPRLARWLLMTHDRAGSRSIHVTQEFLAQMLGVRRVGITAAAKEMQRGGLIDYSRGRVTVLDHRGLRAASCSCYKTDRQLFTAMLKSAARPTVNPPALQSA
ncbi:Crp/Fnr family transcriptional regulator [Ramlibacter henchirensis]|uniref:Crp/Fnr family transcriptional regulator n=1 Tax=Ramlibacter henchirensis TaxID=204072 RepID=A0A4Z0BR23_9BURK|nr:Crp/Fnr family transcriptional regulator [Ramlibacter henchirensis]TFZ00698.1 Crp/Fnr family transcriptional regulator [Ramlibacter henchirensis]